MCNGKPLCDTLVSDDGASDECPWCGRVYDHLAIVGIRRAYTPPPAPTRAPAVGELARSTHTRSRGVKVRHINGFRR